MRDSLAERRRHHQDNKIIAQTFCFDNYLKYGLPTGWNTHMQFMYLKKIGGDYRGLSQLMS